MRDVAVNKNYMSQSITQKKPLVNSGIQKKVEKSQGNTLLDLLMKAFPPLFAFTIIVGGWQFIVTMLGTPAYILPKPTEVVMAAINNYENLLAAVYTSFSAAIIGFLFSVIFGVSGAVLLATTKIVERSLFPYVVILQTIPIIAVAPIIVIWFGAGKNAIVIIAFLIGFFPMLSNTLIGLNSTAQNLKDLFFLYNANFFQTLLKLRLPAALPYIVAGLKISCTLAVIGVIAGEYIAGIGGGRGGLGYAITVSATRLQTAYLFACGFAASIMGIGFYLVVNRFSKMMLSSWHESEMKN